MAPKAQGRMIKKDISNSNGFASLSPEAAVLFTMLIPHYNAHGKMNGGAGYIKDEICPKIPYLTYKNIPKLLKEINDKTNVKWFENNGRHWIHSLNFLTEHQDLRRDRMGPDLLPEYSGNGAGMVRPEVEGKEEGKGKDKDNSTSDQPCLPNLPDLPNTTIDGLKILSEIPNYPFNEKIDSEFLIQKGKEYPSIDIIPLLKAWKTYLLDVPLNNKSRPRSQLHNQFELAIKWNRYKKQIQREVQPSTLDKIKAAQKEIETYVG